VPATAFELQWREDAGLTKGCVRGDATGPAILGNKTVSNVLQLLPVVPLCPPLRSPAIAQEDFGITFVGIRNGSRRDTWSVPMQLAAQRIELLLS
jgi:hypothetical protein